jgi:hypothetical protein
VTAPAAAGRMLVLRDGRSVRIRRAVPDDAAAILAYLGRAGGETINLTFGAEGPGISVEEEREYLARVAAADNSLAILRTDNVPAIHLYQQMGWVLEGRTTRDTLIDGEFADCLLMGREVDPA